MAFNNIAEILKVGGYMLLVFREGNEIQKTSTFNNIQYERNFVYHQREDILKAMDNNFVFVKELDSNDSWKYLIYKRV